MSSGVQPKHTCAPKDVQRRKRREGGERRQEGGNKGGVQTSTNLDLDFQPPAVLRKMHVCCCIQWVFSGNLGNYSTNGNLPGKRPSPHHHQLRDLPVSSAAAAGRAAFPPLSCRRAWWFAGELAAGISSHGCCPSQPSDAQGH